MRFIVDDKFLWNNTAQAKRFKSEVKHIFNSAMMHICHNISIVNGNAIWISHEAHCRRIVEASVSESLSVTGARGGGEIGEGQLRQKSVRELA